MSLCRPLARIALLSLIPSCAAFASEEASYAIGAGAERMPSWMGSRDHRIQPLPYIDITLPDIGELSTADGLTVDFIHGQAWHGGLYGNYLWGRTSDDLGALGGKITSLSPRFLGGGYVEYEFSKQWTLGSHLSHDTGGAGAYFAVYADWKLPDLGYIEHSFEFQWEAMNGAAMRRFFGVTAAEAERIGTQAWRPAAGGEQAYVEYDAFIPTSQHTGFALSLNYGRLLGDAASSPLVRRYGTRTQFSQSLAFVYHF
ncbi:outer membrane scaffolding protein for murein synthesis (MipA/OmpV family) [Luteibacter sp. Sphag1AF]|uniref:MipA/OmpV family protein n=1 Tax=Luteibacter sp. Sphag1AF TaxID=2587031 RepID=UPI00160DF458|nr:MipA/OmpV family protein [Luteibacter sp. Sphag1AF]MBB3225687.1 outer membrane scaffolding protein for murein synthesis (MipA/OmpV family) [Luteibacter sp. Sphag1AF]